MQTPPPSSEVAKLGFLLQKMHNVLKLMHTFFQIFSSTKFSFKVSGRDLWQKM